MGQKEKLIKKLKSVPKDMTFEEVETLLRYLTYLRSNKGKTSGSRVLFSSDSHPRRSCCISPTPARSFWRIKSNSSSKSWNRRD